jgi:hypothetical protein
MRRKQLVFALLLFFTVFTVGILRHA